MGGKQEKQLVARVSWVKTEREATEGVVGVEATATGGVVGKAAADKV